MANANNSQSNLTSVLATHNEIKLHIASKRFKKNVYDAYSEYINFLEQLLETLSSEADIKRITLEIKKLCLEQQKYYDKTSLESSSYELVKKIDKKYKNVKILNKNKIKTQKVGDNNG